jgi:hypothetical protein
VRDVRGLTTGRGAQGLDNGYLRFTEVHIPRENMLMKWSQVSRDGTYTAPPIPQMAYGALIGGRVAIVRCCTTCCCSSVSCLSL